MEVRSVTFGPGIQQEREERWLKDRIHPGAWEYQPGQHCEWKGWWCPVVCKEGGSRNWIQMPPGPFGEPEAGTRLYGTLLHAKPRVRRIYDIRARDNRLRLGRASAQCLEGAKVLAQLSGDDYMGWEFSSGYLLKLFTDGSTVLEGPCQDRVLREEAPCS